MSMKFKIHIAPSAKELTELINTDLESGWALHGHLIVSNYGQVGLPSFYQAMTKAETQSYWPGLGPQKHTTSDQLYEDAFPLIGFEKDEEN